MDISDLDGISTAVQYYQPSIRYNPCCKSADKLTCKRQFVETLELTTTKHCEDRKQYTGDYSITGTYTRSPSVCNKCDKYHINHQVIFSNSL